MTPAPGDELSMPWIELASPERHTSESNLVFRRRVPGPRPVPEVRNEDIVIDCLVNF